jgi:hypothetical protein
MFFATQRPASPNPSFQGGNLLQKERTARATYSIVLAAFQIAADSLHALEQDADGLKAAVAARDAAKVRLDLRMVKPRRSLAGVDRLVVGAL